MVASALSAPAVRLSRPLIPLTSAQMVAPSDPLFCWLTTRCSCSNKITDGDPMPHWSNFSSSPPAKHPFEFAGIQQPACRPGISVLRSSRGFHTTNTIRRTTLNGGRDDDKADDRQRFHFSTALSRAARSAAKKASVEKLYGSILPQRAKIPLHHRFIDFIIQPEMFHGCFQVLITVTNPYPLWFPGAQFILLSGTSPTMVTSPLPFGARQHGERHETDHQLAS